MHVFLIYFSVIVSGSCILSLEILGTRWIGPAFGVSLYLWSALIGVTLAALSVGYALGGRIADRDPSLRRFSWPFLLAGLWVVAIPWLRHPVLAWAGALDLRAAVLVSATILFFPPLALLGMVSPFAIRLKAAKLDEIGRSAGDLFAVSTIASVAAAIGCGFFLIPHLGVARLTTGIGALLLLTGVGVIALAGRSRSALAAVVLLLPVGATAYRLAPEAHADPASGLLEVTQSAYAEIRVLEHKGLRFMLIDGNPHTIVDPASWESDYGYVDVIGIAKKFRDEPGRMLLVGLGGGSLAKVFSRDGWRVEAVEIDPEVARIAVDWFGLLPADAQVRIDDGRRFLLREVTPRDLIVLDAFGSSSIPFHLVTREAFALMKSRLAPGGILALNLEAEGWHDILVHAAANTLAAEFAHVAVLPMEEPPSRFGNVVVMASDEPLELPDSAFPLPTERWTLEYNQMHAWDNRFAPDPGAAPVLTDDLNPVDIWSDRINRASRQELIAYFGVDSLVR